jgi:hypothetical protein
MRSAPARTYDDKKRVKKKKKKRESATLISITFAHVISSCPFSLKTPPNRFPAPSSGKATALQYKTVEIN